MIRAQGMGTYNAVGGLVRERTEHQQHTQKGALLVFKTRGMGGRRKIPTTRTERTQTGVFRHVWPL